MTKIIIVATTCLLMLIFGGRSIAHDTAELTAEQPIIEETVESPTTVAYYFYNTVRCKSCLAIESMSHEVIESEFAAEIASGRLVWQMKNLDEEENEHFIEDYKLYTKSLVLVEFENGEQTRWQNCTKVWELLNKEEEFKQYVSDEVTAFLGKQ